MLEGVSPNIDTFPRLHLPDNAGLLGLVMDGSCGRSILELALQSGKAARAWWVVPSGLHVVYADCTCMHAMRLLVR